MPLNTRTTSIECSSEAAGEEIASARWIGYRSAAPDSLARPALMAKEGERWPHASITARSYRHLSVMRGPVVLPLMQRARDPLVPESNGSKTHYQQDMSLRICSASADEVALRRTAAPGVDNVPEKYDWRKSSSKTPRNSLPDDRLLQRSAARTRTWNALRIDPE